MFKNPQHNHGIQCHVTSCCHNAGGCDCDLESIEVSPCSNCQSGKAEDESMCKSYRCKC